MLFSKPHKGARRYKITENVSPSTFEVRGFYYDTPATDDGQLTPEKPGVHFDAQGVEIDRPHLWMWDSANDYEVNDLVIIGARWFVVCKPQQIFDAEPLTAHRLCYLEEIDAELGALSNPDL